MTHLMTPEEIHALIPTVTLKGEKPVTMVWLKQSDAIVAMRNVEAVKNQEIDALKAELEELRERTGRSNRLHALFFKHSNL